MGRRTKRLAGLTLAAFLAWAGIGVVMATFGQSAGVVGLFAALAVVTLALAATTVLRFVRRAA